MSILSDFGLDRRQDARTTVESLTYICFGSNDRGIVLDISESGLRFRVLSPIEHTEQPVRFWFSAEGERVDAEGEVRWMDEQQVTGGLRFRSVSSETREQIRRLIRQPDPALAGGDLAASRKLLLANSGNESGAMEKIRSAVQTKKMPGLGVFARGMVSGLAVAALLALAILIRIDRSHLGEMLIEVGQRMLTRTAASTLAGTPPLAPTSEASASPTSPAQGTSGAKAPKVVYNEPAVVIAGTSPPASLPMPEARRSPTLIPAPPEENKTSESTADVAENKETLKPDVRSEPSTSAENIMESRVNPNFAANKYLDVREFRQKAAAEKLETSLGQLGYHTAVNRKGHLWMNSYHVLVGPYASDAEIETARNDLESHGLRPQSRSRLSRKFLLPTMTLADKDTVVKDCVISWDANSSAATVTFVRGDNVVLKAQGKWVKRGVTYKLDAVLSDSPDRGPLKLLEIHCHGMSQALVFDESNPIQYFVPPFRGGDT